MDRAPSRTSCIDRAYRSCIAVRAARSLCRGLVSVQCGVRDGGLVGRQSKARSPNTAAASTDVGSLSAAPRKFGDHRVRPTCAWHTSHRDSRTGMTQRSSRTLLALGSRVACCCIVWFGSSIAIICELRTRSQAHTSRARSQAHTSRSAPRRHEQVLSERTQL